MRKDINYLDSSNAQRVTGEHARMGWVLFLKNDSGWALLCALYALASRPVVAHTTSGNLQTQLDPLLWLLFAPPIVAGLLLSVCFHTLVIVHPAHPTRHIITQANALADIAKLVSGLLGYFFVAVLIFSFGQMKSLIDTIALHRWDETFRLIDLRLGGGQYPHDYLAWLLTNRLTYEALSVIYHPIWASCCLGLLAYALFISPPGEKRSTFLLSFVASWIMTGTVLAIIFNSGGPIFYEAYIGTPAYHELTSRLSDLTDPDGFGSLLLAQKLAAYKTAGIAPAGFGISAMPSMHVAIATLALLRAWHMGPWARTLAGGFLAAVYAGSIVLGWHYATDGIASCLITLAIWYGASRAVKIQRKVLAP